MDVSEVGAALIASLQEIQKESGLGCPPLDGSMIAPEVVPSFDSTVWPVATTMVGQKLGVEIPDDVHIFGGYNKAPLLTIQQASELICAKAVAPKTAAAA